MTASRWGLILIAALLPLSAQAMSRKVAISAGSFFAAAFRCEAENLITPGQADDLLKTLDPFLSKSDKANMAAGRIRGDKDKQVFVDTENKWFPFTPDIASCSRVQGVLDDYKAQLGE